MTVRILVGDALSRLRELPDNSVHCCVTSPPYWGLRAYGGEDGMIGLEETFDAHLDNLLVVFREVRRVLRPDGTLWLNYGDAYAGSGRGGGSPGKEASGHAERGGHSGQVPSNLKPKDLMMMPSRVAIALQDDGWWLRSEIVWSKPNPMPESVRDRPTNAHEKIFLLAPSAKYFYDAHAVRRPPNSGPSDLRKMEEQKERIGGKHKDLEDPKNKANKDSNIGRMRAVGSPDGANLGNVWDLEPEPDTHARRKDGRRANAKGHDPNDRRGSGKNAKPSSWATSPNYQNQDPRYPKRTPKDEDGRSARMGRAPGWRKERDYDDASRPQQGFEDRWDGMSREEQLSNGANLRNVWRIAIQGFRGAHFATFPTSLAMTCIKAGTSEHGVCAACGAPWTRLVDRTDAEARDCPKTEAAHAARGGTGAPSAAPVRHRRTAPWDGPAPPALIPPSSPPAGSPPATATRTWCRLWSSIRLPGAALWGSWPTACTATPSRSRSPRSMRPWPGTASRTTNRFTPTLPWRNPMTIDASEKQTQYEHGRHQILRYDNFRKGVIAEVKKHPGLIAEEAYRHPTFSEWLIVDAQNRLAAALERQTKMLERREALPRKMNYRMGDQ